MRRHRIALLAVPAMVIGLTLVPASPAAAQVRPLIDCTQSPSNNANVKAKFTGSGVNIRTGPGTSCTVVGSGNPGNSVTARCAKYNGSTLWIYLKDNTTGKIGWSSSAYVSLSGTAIILC
jgi:uncharacterized protein YraI